MSVVLRARGLSFSYDGPVIVDLDLEVGTGECLVLLGSNGAGKTTLLRLLGGIAKPSGGRIVLDGKPMDQLNARVRARCIGMLPQDVPRAAGFAVYELVLTGRYASLPARGWEGFNDWLSVGKALRNVGAKGLIRRPFDELSGGEQRRVLLARALVSNPRLLLLDEPLASLDPGFALEMIALLERIKREGAAQVIATHDLSLAQKVADRVVLLRRGRPAVIGAPRELLVPAELNRTYGTAAFSAPAGPPLTRVGGHP